MKPDKESKRISDIQKRIKIASWTCTRGHFNFASSTVCGNCRERRPDASGYFKKGNK